MNLNIRERFSRGKMAKKKIRNIHKWNKKKKWKKKKSGKISHFAKATARWSILSFSFKVPKTYKRKPTITLQYFYAINSSKTHLIFQNDTILKSSRNGYFEKVMVTKGKIVKNDLFLGQNSKRQKHRKISSRTTLPVIVVLFQKWFPML